ncbi:hypothetical protein MN116_005909 [Schistosoma mekongi]|uniref:Ubiquitin-like domain-containing protein n=1 Tax=Schistosoma mekongi TaxID=38744 RepID=A0AAE1Z9Y0_SCHME|nr:hypothetical protein MN116_005909 [Schistosoma mekongi]
MDETNAGKEQEQLKYSNSNMYVEELYEDINVESRNMDRKNFGVNTDDEKHCEFQNITVHDNTLQKYTSYDRQDDIIAVSVPANDTQQSKLHKKKCDDNSDAENSPTRFYNDPEDSVTVCINTEYGVLLELYLVPKKFNIMDLKIILVKDTGISHEDLILRYNGEDVNSDTSLVTIAEENKLLSLTVLLGNAEDSLNIKLGCREVVLSSGIVIKIIGKKFAVTKDTYSLENVLLVNKKNEGKTDVENIHIKWLPYGHHKPFLGGYRNIVTNCRYHNASSQTKPIPRKTPQAVKTSRDTQTYKMRHFGNITVNHMSTQFPKPGFFVSNCQNRVKTPGLYETADEYLARVLTKVRRMLRSHK